MFRQESKPPPPDEKPSREGALVRLFYPVPPLTGTKDLWINTDTPIAFEAGKVYLVHYWTFGWINCKRNLPSYGRWENRFAREIRDGKLTFVGVHTPETEDEKRFENVVREVKKQGVRHPVLFDPKGENWTRWQQQVWPTVYLVDKRRRVRYYWVGELEWRGAGGEAKMGGFLEQLLRE